MSLTVKMLISFRIVCLHFHLLYIFNWGSKGLLTSFQNIQLPEFASKASSLCCFGGGCLAFCFEIWEGIFLFVFVFQKLMRRCQEAKNLPMGSMNLFDLQTAYLILRRNSICLALDEIQRTYRHSIYCNRVKRESEKDLSIMLLFSSPLSWNKPLE